MINSIYSPAPDRYDSNMKYRRCGKSGILLPEISLGLWHNFGDVNAFSNSLAMAHYAFDRGITHFDLANNYGPSCGSGRHRSDDIAPALPALSASPCANPGYSPAPR